MCKNELWPVFIGQIDERTLLFEYFVYSHKCRYRTSFFEPSLITDELNINYWNHDKNSKVADRDKILNNDIISNQYE